MIRPFIDAHVHLNTLSSQKMDRGAAFDARFLSINTDIPFFIPLSEQRERALLLEEEFPDMVRFITSFSVANWKDEDWAEQAIEQVKDGMAAGAVGVKVWKNIGMELQDEQGEFVMLDDPKFDPLFEYLENEGVLVIGHLGEPKNCWLPLEEMTVDSDRNYFSQHPEYHMYLHPEYPSYENQMQARDRRLEKHPKLKFVGLHLASLEWSIGQVSQWLERFPFAMTDLAERICHLQLQSISDWQGVRDFMIRYQDRIIYGTDVIDDGSMSAEEVADRFQQLWEFHYRFFAGSETMEAPEFEGSFRGLALPEEVLKKIFFFNAARTYGFDH